MADYNRRTVTLPMASHSSFSDYPSSSSCEFINAVFSVLKTTKFSILENW